jgi:hypothetical protein
MPFHHIEISDLKTLKSVYKKTITCILLPNSMLFSYSSSELLITSIYWKFLDLVSYDNKDWQCEQRSKHLYASQTHATVIVGQPGIGTLFTFYFLAQH